MSIILVEQNSRVALAFAERTVEMSTTRSALACNSDIGGAKPRLLVDDARRSSSSARRGDAQPALRATSSAACHVVQRSEPSLLLITTVRSAKAECHPAVLLDQDDRHRALAT